MQPHRLRMLLPFLLGMTVLLLRGSPVHAQSTDLSGVTAELEAGRAAPLIVDLALPAAAEVQAAALREAAIASAQQAVLNELAAFNVSNVKTYQYTPQLALTVDSPAALAQLQASAQVRAIYKDELNAPTLIESVPLIRAHHAHTLFYRGDGQVVAVLDTGVDKNHPALAGKVVSEACYSTNLAGQGASSLCPGGATSSTASNSGLNCAANIGGCDHGTHVAGIVAGVAPAAQLIAIQVFSRITDGGGVTSCSDVGWTSPCTLAYTSDIISGLNRVFALSNGLNVAAVNMSLGGGSNTGTCDSDPRKSAIDLLAVGIPGVTTAPRVTTVIAAGNSGFRNAMGAPACISTAVSVGATTKSDAVASFSNVSTQTTLWAPGFDIAAAVPPNLTDEKNGTSMAAPHVAGAVAILKQVKTDATAAEMKTILANTGPLITDQRSGGSWTKPRLDVYLALCGLVNCDNDDYRTLLLEQSLAGTISFVSDRDHYFFNGTAGQQITISMDRTSGGVDPYLELFTPQGVRVALNNNSGTGTNALINGRTLQHTGRYLIVARNVGLSGGDYTIRVSAQSVNLNPTPSISSLSPSSATGTLGGSDFWVQIRGSNFTPTSQVRWNGATRNMFYTSSTRIWIRVRGSDLGLPWPRTAQITVVNPAPGGGTSNARSFQVTFPFLGTSELVQPETGAIIPTEVKTSFVLSWTTPITITSWRHMQNMDLRLRDETGRTAAWVRVVERPGTDSVYRLLNDSAVSVSTSVTATIPTPDEGLPGIDKDIVLTDTVTLHLADSAFSGSGRTAVMTPTLTFGPNAVGTYNVEFRVDGPDGEVQDDDVLGQITIVPAGCPFAVVDGSVDGPGAAMAGVDHVYTASIAPLDATMPISYTWSPEPKSGQGSATAVYNWSSAGEKTVFFNAENCGGFTGFAKTVRVYTTEAPDLSISKRATPVVKAGELITYTLTVTNSGVMTATNLEVTDVLPADANYAGGGTLSDGLVAWSVPVLGGYGSTTQVQFAVTATRTITNSIIGVSADGDYSAYATAPVVTEVATDKLDITGVTGGTLAGMNTDVHVEAGSSADDATIALTELDGPSYPVPETMAAGAEPATVTPLVSFRLQAYDRVLTDAATIIDHPTMTTVHVLSGPVHAAAAVETTTGLYFWNGSAWSSEGIACTATATELICQSDVALPAEFAVLRTEIVDPGPVDRNVYLPLVMR